jgi:hypothetical protein
VEASEAVKATGIYLGASLVALIGLKGGEWHGRRVLEKDDSWQQCALQTLSPFIPKPPVKMATGWGLCSWSLLSGCREQQYLPRSAHHTGHRRRRQCAGPPATSGFNSGRCQKTRGRLVVTFNIHVGLFFFSLKNFLLAYAVQKCFIQCT